jgi:spermidine/putrescine transport system substrate-binding protein
MGGVISRREFLASASLLLAGAACSRGGSSSVQTFASTFVSPGNQTLELDLVIAAARGEIATSTISAFHRATRVTVTQQPMGSGDELLLRLAAGDYGQVDLAVVDASTLSYMVDAGQVEPLARKLIPNGKALQQPFNDSPFDSGLRHSVPAWYDTVGVAVSPASAIASDTWQAFFALAERHPGRVVVPDTADDVIGAVLVSLGHAWDSDSAGDLSDAHDRLVELRSSLHVPGVRLRTAPRVRNLSVLARLVRSDTYRRMSSAVRFYVPSEGSAYDMRSYCIPIYAPHPVAAHAWLEAWLDPAVEAAAIQELMLAVPLLEARTTLPASLVDNGAICPNADAIAASIQPNISANGRLMRDALWTELHL